MNKIIEYRAVTASGDVKELNKEVKKALEDGFQPFGEVSTCVDNDCVYFTQAMVKYERSASIPPAGGIYKT